MRLQWRSSQASKTHEGHYEQQGIPCSSWWHHWALSKIYSSCRESSSVLIGYAIIKMTYFRQNCWNSTLHSMRCLSHLPEDLTQVCTWFNAFIFKSIFLLNYYKHQCLELLSSTITMLVKIMTREPCLKIINQFEWNIWMNINRFWRLYLNGKELCVMPSHLRSHSMFSKHV